MRPLSPFPVLASASFLLSLACAASDGSEPTLIDDFLARSDSIRCPPVPRLNPDGLRIADVSPAGDTAFLVLYADARRVVLHRRSDLRPDRTVPFTRSGPAGVASPVSAALAGDTLVYIADESARVLKRLALSGEDRGTVRLPFTARAVRDSPAGLRITPTVLGETPPGLLYTLAGPDLRSHPVPPTPFPDFTVNALGNTALPLPLGDGRVIVAHQFLVPAAYRVRPAAPPVRRLPVPLPDGVRPSIGHVPTMPLTDEQTRRMATPVIALAADPRHAELLYVTRTGRRRSDTMEKAIIRTDEAFRYRRSYIPDVNAAHLVYLADRSVSLVADPEGRWFACPTP